MPDYDESGAAYGHEQARALVSTYGVPSRSKSKEKPAPEANSAFRALLADAENQTGFHVIVDDDHSVRGTIKKPAASAVHTNFNELKFPQFGDSPARAIHFPTGNAAGVKSTLPAALLATSRVARAGATIIHVPEPSAGTAINGQVVLARQNARFDLIEAADFVTAPDGEDSAESTLPFHTAPINIDETANRAFRVKLTRAGMRAYERGYLADVALQSILLGIAREADRVLLEAVAASTPDAFSLGAAAAQGFEFSELRAMVGSDGAGAVVGQDGTLRAAGVLAELTPVVPGTFVGSFGRSAVAISERITLTAERINLHSDLNLICWVNMEAVLPMPDAFWAVEDA